MIETLETYDLFDKRLLEVRFLIGHQGIIQSHGASYLNMRKHLQKCEEPMGFDERVPRDYKDWVASYESHIHGITRSIPVSSGQELRGSDRNGKVRKLK